MAARIVFAGSFEPGSISESQRQALTRAGCDVVTFDFPRHRVRSTLLQRLRNRPLVSAFVEGRVLAHLNYQLADLLHGTRPELFVSSNGTFLLPGTVAAARHLGATTVNLWGEPVLHLNEPNVIAALPLFDAVFAFDRAVMPLLSDAGARRVEYLPLAYDPDLHRPPGPLLGEGRGPARADLVFVGKWSPERERLLEPLCGFDLAIWGDDTWKRYTARNSPVRRRWTGETAVGERYARVCAQAKICLNLIEPTASQSANMRSFELPGMGRFMLAPRNDSHSELFVEGAEIACFGSPAELRQQIERYLPLEDERERMGAAARTKVLAAHTYDHRMRHLLQAFGAAAGPATKPQSAPYADQRLSA